MKLKLNEPLLLSKPIELISELVLEVRIKVNEFGLSLTALDPANVAMVNFKLPKSAFSEFESGNEVLGVNLDNLKKILKRCGKTSSLIIEKNENMLDIKIEDKIKRSFSLCLIEVEGDDREMPKLEYCTRIELDSQDLIDAIEDTAVISDACSFIVSDGKFIIESKEINSARAEFSPESISIQAEDCSSRYSLDYLQKFMKAAKISEKTKISFASNHPLRLDFGQSTFNLSFVLAPRVENED
jgi:proliferating cell nuclear antigen